MVKIHAAFVEVYGGVPATGTLAAVNEVEATQTSWADLAVQLSYSPLSLDRNHRYIKSQPQIKINWFWLNKALYTFMFMIKICWCFLTIALSKKCEKIVKKCPSHPRGEIFKLYSFLPQQSKTQKVLTFEKLKAGNIWQFCLLNHLNDKSTYQNCLSLDVLFNLLTNIFSNITKIKCVLLKLGEMYLDRLQSKVYKISNKILMFECLMAVNTIALHTHF